MTKTNPLSPELIASCLRAIDELGEAAMLFELKSTPTIIAALEQAAAQQQGWQTIETAPKDGTEILGYNEETDHIWLAHWEEVEKNWFPCVGDTALDPLTHWMPLPQTPHSKEGE